MLLSKLKSLVFCINKTCQFETIVKHRLQLHCSNFCSTCSILLAGKDPSTISTALSFSENAKSYVLGTQLHACVIKLGHTNDVFSQNNLIKMYTKCGYLGDAFKLFDDMVERNLVSWTLMISGAVQNVEFQVGLEIYLDLVRSGLRPNEFTLGSVLKICASAGSYDFGSSIHCFALKIGIEQNLFVGSSILNMYAKLEDIRSAKEVFESMSSADVGCWNAIIGGYLQCGYGIDALKIVSLMLPRGISMDQFTFINALKGCSITGNLDFGKQLHGLVIPSDMEYNTSLMNCLMDMYFRNDTKDSALKVFNRIQNKDVISWNTTFASISQQANARKLADLFHEFRLDTVKPNHITFSILFRLCAELVDLDLGLQFFCLALQFGFHDETNITRSLINMFSRCNAMGLVSLIFDNNGVFIQNITAWNELISAYTWNYCYMEALKVFDNLWGLGVELNEYTFSSVLEACSKFENQQIFRQIHGAIIKSGFSFNVYVCSLLINGYVKFGLLDDCFEFLNGHEKLDLVCWSSMISALTQEGHTYEAIGFLKFLKEGGEKPDEFIFGSVLNCCASIAGYFLTKSIHSLVIKMGFNAQAFVASGVIDAYAKCGDINSSMMAYSQSDRLNDVIIHNTMIMAFAHHGFVMEAMKIFEKMKLSNLHPSQATFVSAISACSHMGLIDQGLDLFRSMVTDYKMEPSPDVYGCLVDMLSRNGYLDNARRIIEVMPYAPWPAILRSLLSGCRIYGNRELGEWTAEKLIQLVPEDDAPFVLLSKVYSECGVWEETGEVQRSMIERSVEKSTGYSWIEV